MSYLLRHPATWIWVLLASATAFSWWLGTEGVPDTDRARLLTTIAIMGVSFVKVRLVISYFMEVRHAPWPLKLACDGWLVLSCIAILGLYVAGMQGHLEIWR